MLKRPLNLAFFVDISRSEVEIRLFQSGIFEMPIIMAFLSFFLFWVQLFDRVISLIFFVLSLFGPVVPFSKI